MFVKKSLSLPLTALDSVVCLSKQQCNLDNCLKIRVKQFLQRRRVLIAFSINQKQLISGTNKVYLFVPLVFLWGKLVSEYRHFPDKSHRDAVGVVIFLSPGYGFRGKVVGAAHIREEKVQVAFHGIELDSSQIAP